MRGTYNVVLILNGKTQSKTQITLEPSEARQVIFILPDNKQGIYSTQIDGLRKDFTVVRWYNWPLIVGLSIAIGSLIWVIWYLLKRRRRRTT